MKDRHTTIKGTKGKSFIDPGIVYAPYVPDFNIDLKVRIKTTEEIKIQEFKSWLKDNKEENG